MSDIENVPPPPPAPPTAAPAKPAFDFVKPFAFVFQDPRWLNKILIGGLFELAAVFIIGIFFVMGYCAQLARNVIAGVELPLPEWDDLGEFFSEGLKLFAIVLIYTLPLIIFAGAVFVPAAVMSGSGREILENLGGGMMTCAWCLFFPLSLLFSFYIPAALLFAVAERDFGAAFQVGRIIGFIRNNAGNYVVAFVVYLIARFAAPLGLVMCCIGVVFTAFWTVLVATHAFAQAYRFRNS